MKIKLNIRNHYFNEIKSGRKLFEGRLAYPFLLKLTNNDVIQFINGTNIINCKILEIKKFDNFKSMIEYCDVKYIIPGNTLDEAIQIYEELPNYKSLVKKMGVLSIKIEII